MRGVDTNVLVRFLTRDDPVQAVRVKDALEKMAEGGGASWRISVIVLCELAWVLRTALGFRKEQISGALDSLLDTTQFSIEDRDMVREAVLLYRDGTGDFSDYLIGLRNRRAGCPDTLTFDRALARSDLFSML
jgi:predicted nucleic-acid-binding protein